MKKKRFALTRWFLIFLSFQSFFFMALSAFAEDLPTPTPPGPLSTPSPENKLGGHYIFYGDLAGRLNPRGLGFYTGVNYRQVYGYDEKYDAASAYVQTGLELGVSPATSLAGVHVEWLPWIFLPLRLEYDFYEYLGGNDGLLSFDSANSPFGDEVRKNRHDEETAPVQRLLFQPTLQGRVDRFILRNQTDFAYFRFSGRGPYFLELGYDTLLKDGDYLISNRTEVLYSLFPDKAKTKLLIGPYYEMTRAFAAGINQQKLGLSLYWEPNVRVKYIGRPHLGVTTAYHLEDPSRQGQLYFLMGAGFQFSLSPGSH